MLFWSDSTFGAVDIGHMTAYGRGRKKGGVKGGVKILFNSLTSHPESSLSRIMAGGQLNLIRNALRVVLVTNKVMYPKSQCIRLPAKELLDLFTAATNTNFCYLLLV